MQVSARNILSGTVTKVVKGPVSTEVTLAVAPGLDIVAVISTTSADALLLAPGKLAHAIIKASSVMVGVD